MKTLHCSDAGFICQAVIHAATEEEILQQAAKHAQEVHGVSVTAAQTEEIKKLIKES